MEINRTGRGRNEEVHNDKEDRNIRYTKQKV